MTKDLAEVKPEYPDTSLAEKIPGHNLYHAPQPALTTASGGSLSGGGIGSLGNGDQAILNNALQRIKDMETALIKLGLIKHP